MRYLLLLSLLFLMGCQNERPASALRDTDHAVMAETASTNLTTSKADVPSPITAVTVDSTDLSPEPSDDIKILLTGSFHKEEVWQGAQHKEWLALTFENGNYILQPAKLSVKPVYDPIVDQDTLHISGRMVSGDKENIVVFITGLTDFRKGKIDTVTFEEDVLAPSKKISLPFKKGSYNLQAFGDSSLVNGAGYYSIKDYGWKVSGIKKGKKIEQVLAEDKEFDAATYVLLWMGDLDNDGIPDIIADLSNDYNGSKITLFLSSRAPKNKLYFKAASFETVGC